MDSLKNHLQTEVATASHSSNQKKYQQKFQYIKRTENNESTNAETTINEQKKETQMKVLNTLKPNTSFKTSLTQISKVQPQTSQNICQFYLKNTCKFGTSCKNSHQGQEGEVRRNKLEPRNKENKTMENNHNEDPISRIKSIKPYKFDPMMSKDCRDLAIQARAEKIKGYVLEKDDEEEEHRPAVIGDKDNYNMILIRHAMSESNFIQSKYTKGVSQTQFKRFKQHFRYFLYDSTDAFMDTSLHPIGVKQCSDITYLNTSIPYKTVYVSPLRRTMQTCIELFKNHPNRSKINFIVYPDIAEMMKKDTDIFLDKEFQILVEKARADFEIHFDTKQFYDPEWQFNHIKNSYELDGVYYTPHLMKKLIVQIFPQPLEPFPRFQSRIKRAITALRGYQRKSKEITGIVTHSLVAREFLTSQNIEQDEEIENLSFIYYKNI